MLGAACVCVQDNCFSECREYWRNNLRCGLPFGGTDRLAGKALAVGGGAEREQRQKQGKGKLRSLARASEVVCVCALALLVLSRLEMGLTPRRQDIF